MKKRCVKAFGMIVLAATLSLQSPITVLADNEPAAETPVLSEEELAAQAAAAEAAAMEEAEKAAASAEVTEAVKNKKSALKSYIEKNSKKGTTLREQLNNIYSLFEKTVDALAEQDGVTKSDIEDAYDAAQENAESMVDGSGSGSGSSSSSEDSGDITDEMRGNAYSDIATYTNNLIVSNNTDEEITERLKKMLKNAQKHINNMGGDEDDLKDYVSQVESQMDAVISGIVSSTNELIRLIPGYETPAVKYGDNVSIALPIVNYSDVELTDIVITPQISNLVAEWPFEPKTAGSTQSLAALPAYDPNVDVNALRRDAVFDFKVRSDVMSGYYPLQFEFTYVRGGAIETTTLSTYVKTTGTPEAGSLDGTKDDKNTSKARIVVTGFETNPAKVFAGNTFTLTVHVKNTSKSSGVRNVLFDMQAAEEGKDNDTVYAAFLPTSGASSVYVDSLGADSSTDLVMEMQAKADLSQKPYVLDLNMKYDMTEEVDLTDQAAISIPVYQEQRCEMGNVEISPESISVGEQANVMFDVYNTGKTTLFNVWVKFEGEGISGGDSFLGTIESGNTGSVDAMITGESEIYEDEAVKIVVSYENESGEVTTISKNISIFVSEDMGGEGMGDFDYDEYEEEDGEEESGMLKYILIGAAVFLVVVIVLVIILKHRKKKKALKMEREELEEDLLAIDAENLSELAKPEQDTEKE